MSRCDDEREESERKICLRGRRWIFVNSWGCEALGGKQTLYLPFPGIYTSQESPCESHFQLVWLVNVAVLSGAELVFPLSPSNAAHEKDVVYCRYLYINWEYVLILFFLIVERTRYKSFHTKLHVFHPNSFLSLIIQAQHCGAALSVRPSNFSCILPPLPPQSCTAFATSAAGRNLLKGLWK